MSPRFRNAFQFLASASLVMMCGVSMFDFGHANAATREPTTVRAAAVVNDLIISTYDLDQRIKLVMVTSGAQGPDTAKRLRPQVLRQLVDELLQMQEAQKNNVKITNEDLDKSLRRIGQQNNISIEDIFKTLDSNGISRTTLQNQIKADLAWQKLVQQRLAPRVTISDDEVDAEYLRAQESSKQPQYLLAEIFLAVDTPGSEEQVKQSIQNILGQLRSGANFGAIARQFSQSASASSGGDMGWVTLGDLPDPLAAAVKTLSTGMVSEPVRAPGGYYLVALRQKRLAAGSSSAAAPAPQPQKPLPEQKMKAVISLARMSLPLPAGAPKSKEDQVRQTAIELFRSVNGCAGAGALARTRGAKFDMVGAVTVRDLAPPFVEILKKTPNGRSTPPLRGANGIEMYVICEGGMRPPPGAEMADGGDKPAAEVSKEEVENRLFNQELSMLARRYLRDRFLT